MEGPFATVTRNPDLNLNQWIDDMSAVYNLALMWYFTGNTAYAQKSHDILIAWATTQTNFGGQEIGLSLGDYAGTYAGGADILRGTWPGWTAADTTTVQNYFLNVTWPASCAGFNTLGPANKGYLTWRPVSPSPFSATTPISSTSSLTSTAPTRPPACPTPCPPER